MTSANTTPTSAAADDPLTPDVGFLLAKTATIAKRQVRDALSTFALNARSYTLLTLVCSLGPSTQRELANQIALDPSQLVPLIDNLEKLGLVSRTPDPADRRTKRIVATVAGRNCQAKAHLAIEPMLVTRTAGFSPAEEQQLISMLQRLIDATQEE